MGACTWDNADLVFYIGNHLRYITIHCTALQCITLHHIVFHCIASLHIAFGFKVLQALYRALSFESISGLLCLDKDTQKEVLCFK